MLGRMSVLGAITAPDVAAFLAHPQVYPGVVRHEAFQAAVAARRDVPDLIKVTASCWHNK